MLHGRSLLLLAVLASCGGRDDGSLFSKEQAQEVVAEFSRALESGLWSQAASLCASPFLFRSQSWDEGIEANLADRAPEILAPLRRSDRIEVISYRELLKGTWPRGRIVPAEEEREREASKLGIRQDGFLVIAMEANRPGATFVVNPNSSATALLVAGTTP